MKFDTIIRGAWVVTPGGVSCRDIGIENGAITALGAVLDGASEGIDAHGLIAMPGGIDSHVHISQPSGPGIEMADDFTSATRISVAGGNTTALRFRLPKEGQTLRDAVSDREILKLKSAAKDQGALVMVHAENENAIEFLRDKAERDGHADPLFHAHAPFLLSRKRRIARSPLPRLQTFRSPPFTSRMERRSTKSGEDVPVAQRSLRRPARKTSRSRQTISTDQVSRGQNTFARSLSARHPIGMRFGSKSREGISNSFPRTIALSVSRIRLAKTGARNNFRNIPNGIPGVETRLPILFFRRGKQRPHLNGEIRIDHGNKSRASMRPQKQGRDHGRDGRGSRPLGLRNDPYDPAKRSPPRHRLHVLGRVRNQRLVRANHSQRADSDERRSAQR